MNGVGCQSMVDEIKVMLVKHPQASHQNQANMDEQWRKLFYTGPQTYETALREYEGFLGLLDRFGLEVGYLPPDATTGHAWGMLPSSTAAALQLPCRKGNGKRRPAARPVRSRRPRPAPRFPWPRTAR